MKTHQTIAHFVLFGILTACDPQGGPDGQGTEIGDEGSGWLCIEDSTVVTEAGADIAALGASPASLIAASTGSYTGAAAALTVVADTADMRWFDNEVQEFEDDYRPEGEPPECVDFLYVAAAVALEQAELSLETTIAGLTYTASGASFRAGALVHQGEVREDPDDDEGGSDGEDDYWAENSSVTTTLQPSTFVVEDMFRVELVLDGTLTDSGWSLELWWMAESYPEGEDGTVSSYEETLWTGTVTHSTAQ